MEKKAKLQLMFILYKLCIYIYTYIYICYVLFEILVTGEHFWCKLLFFDCVCISLTFSLVLSILKYVPRGIWKCWYIFICQFRDLLECGKILRLFSGYDIWIFLYRSKEQFILYNCKDTMVLIFTVRRNCCYLWRNIIQNKILS